MTSRRARLNPGVTRGIAAAVFAWLALAAAAPAQETIGEPIVLTVLQMPEVRVERNVEFKTNESGLPLMLDVYRPISGDGPAPTVVFVNAGGMEVRRWAAYSSWGRLVAASGMAGVTYDALDESNAADLRDVVEYVRANADRLGVDADRIAIWASSRNVVVALPFLADANRDYLRAAVLYYGVTDPDVPLREDVAWLVTRAGLDRPALNQGIDAQVAAALEANVDLTLFNYPGGQHAFDIRDDTDASRRIIAATVAFLKDRLTADTGDDSP